MSNPNQNLKAIQVPQTSSIKYKPKVKTKPKPKSKKTVVKHKSQQNPSVFIAEVGAKLLVSEVSYHDDAPLPHIQLGLNAHFKALDPIQRTVINMLVANYTAQEIRTELGLSVTVTKRWAKEFEQMINEFRRRFIFAFKPIKTAGDLQSFWGGVTSSPYVPYEHRLKASFLLGRSFGMFATVDELARRKVDSGEYDNLEKLPVGDLKKLVEMGESKPKDKPNPKAIKK